MRIKALILALFVLFLAAPATASFESAVKGANGVLTAGFDPIYGATTGKLPNGETIEDLQVFGPVAPAAERVVCGLVGFVSLFHRATLGAIDVMLSPFPKATSYSPDPRVIVVSIVQEE